MNFLKYFSGPLTVVCLFSACQFKNVSLLPATKTEPLTIRDRYVVLVNMDGARPLEINNGVKAGRLPTIEKLFYQDGARYENAITVFPTVSAPSHQAFLSGLFPGHHGVPALDWFSRSQEKYYDYLRPQDISYSNTFLFNFLQVYENSISTDEPQTIFNTLQGHPTMVVFEPTNYGVGLRLPKKPPLLAGFKAHFGRAFEALDHQSIQETLRAFRTLPREELPRFTMVDLYSMDYISHFEGPPSPRASDLYIHYDRFLKELQQVLTERGIWDKTTLIVVSDHGTHQLEGVVNLPAILKNIGLVWEEGNFNKSEVVFGNHGTGTSNLYFKMGSNWQTPPTYSQLRNYPLRSGRDVDLITSLLADPDIEMVIVPEGPWKTHFHFKDQNATVERKRVDGRFLYAYRPDAGKDPFGYLANPTIRRWVEAGSFQDAESWLRETHDQVRPDVIASLPQIFDDYRSGDLLVMTYKEKQFRKDRKYGHGSLHRDDRRVVMMFHGPDIKPGLYAYMRTVDLYPTLMAIYGIRNLAPMDGVLRNEIFLTQNPLVSTRPTRQMDRNAFQEFLREKIRKNDLNEWEYLRALQLKYSMDRFIQNHSAKTKTQMADRDSN